MKHEIVTFTCYFVLLSGVLPLVLTLAVSPPGPHSVEVTVFSDTYLARNTVEYSLRTKHISDSKWRAIGMQLRTLHLTGR